MQGQEERLRMQVGVCLTCKCGERVRGVPRSLLEEGLSSSPFPGNFTGKIEHGTIPLHGVM